MPKTLETIDISTLRDQYKAQRQMLCEAFGIEGKASVFIRQNAALVDGIIQSLMALAGDAVGTVAVIAVGGYGRKELFPYSDIDLLFLHAPGDKDAPLLTRWLIHALWDMGMIVAQSVRTTSEIAQTASTDITTCTSWLDSRLVSGSIALFQDFIQQFQQYVAGSNAMDFVEAKLAERDARHQKCGDSRYVLEPNIKDGKGGLRDLHILYWLVKYIYAIKSYKEINILGILSNDEYKLFVKATDFLFRVRTHLHLAAGRAEERLTFDRQKILAQNMGYADNGGNRAVEQFMKHYFRVAKDVGALTRSVCAVLEESGKRKPRINLGMRMRLATTTDDFILDGERLAVADEQDFRKNPVKLLTLFQLSHETGLDIQPRTFQLASRSLWLIDAKLRRNENANNAFMSLLLSTKNPDHILRQMSESGVLGRFIPEFGRVTGQMQFDMYHVYTVDEHTLRAISILHNIGNGTYRDEMPLGTALFPHVASPRVLFLALLTHDIAKGRGGDHSVLGEVMVRKLARRFRLDAFETETW